MLLRLSETITITGGGLTGLSLAIALRRYDIPVVLHEAGSYPRHRVCGEFISGISQETLTTLGIAETLADAQLHRSVTWFSGNDLLRKNSPYFANAENSSKYSTPTSTGIPGRRVLNLIIIDCDAPSSQVCSGQKGKALNTLAVGKFFMPVPANLSGKELLLEFVSTITALPPADIKLYR